MKQNKSQILMKENVVSLIVEKTNMSKEEIEQEIENTLSNLNNMVNEDGAALIVANNLGVTLNDQSDPYHPVDEVLNNLNELVADGDAEAEIKPDRLEQLYKELHELWKKILVETGFSTKRDKLKWFYQFAENNSIIDECWKIIEEYQPLVLKIQKNKRKKMKFSPGLYTDDVKQKGNLLLEYDILLGDPPHILIIFDRENKFVEREITTKFIQKSNHDLKIPLKNKDMEIAIKGSRYRIKLIRSFIKKQQITTFSAPVHLRNSQSERKDYPMIVYIDEGIYLMIAPAIKEVQSDE